MGLVTDLSPPPSTAVATGHRRLLEQLRADGVRYLFGNPGSTEEGLLDELTRYPDVEYVLGLQEAALVSTADGYAQASGRPAVVLLHSGAGLGNAIGSIYHAARRQTPLVVLAGEAGVEYDALDAHLAVDLVAMARPVTKYAARVNHPSSLLRLFRRCLKVAATPPRGPVFLAVPQDVLDQPNEEPVTPTVFPQTAVVPDAPVVEQAARLLAGARSPVILVGDGVAASGAVDELARFAETWGAGVYGLTASELVMPWTHPLWRGLSGHLSGETSAATVADADAVLVCGTYLFPDVFPLTRSPFRDGAPVVHIDLDAAAIAKNHPVTLGMVSDPRLTLRALTGVLDETMTDAQHEAAAGRVRSIAEQTARAHAGRLRLDIAERDRGPLRMSMIAEALARLLPADAVVFDESLTHSAELTRWLPPTTPGAFFQTPGGTLGWASRARWARSWPGRTGPSSG
ncbi:thiamine pyrophosphate-binding protein [Phytohabitans rumicis]|uniref:Benzoylformate decarboxylase n=1 Tax=Phytohabitans rumicis TaxID=1076125 RepID=A0A6V8LHD1_9ACTN|nr:thiamine pyrophosphate-binding protein [Phytohabitans rumicis]GFJ94009.1 benzoylformate decarboxylase [Phytohabitans rumicis]